MLEPKFKAKWLAALRSNKYAQGRDWLRNNSKYCCLGVACDVLKPNGWNDANSWQYDNYASRSTTVIPDSVRSLIRLSKKEQDHLINMNDRGDDFNRIADHIEHNL